MKEVNIEQTYMAIYKAVDLKVGDRVRVVGKIDSFRNGWDNYWSTYMDEYKDSCGVVTKLGDTIGIAVSIDNSGTEYYFPPHVLQKIENAETYEYGDILINRETGNTYIIALVGQAKCCLINLSSGNRYSEIKYVDDIFNITLEEMHKMTDGDLYKFKKVNI